MTTRALILLRAPAVPTRSLLSCAGQSVLPIGRVVAPIPIRTQAAPSYAPLNSQPQSTVYIPSNTGCQSILCRVGCQPAIQAKLRWSAFDLYGKCRRSFLCTLSTQCVGSWLCSIDDLSFHVSSSSSPGNERSSLDVDGGCCARFRKNTFCTFCVPCLRAAEPVRAHPCLQF